MKTMADRATAWVDRAVFGQLVLLDERNLLHIWERDHQVQGAVRNCLHLPVP